MNTTQRRWLYVGGGALAIVIVVAIVFAVSGDEASADEPDFSWDDYEVVEVPATSTTAPTTSTTEEPTTSTPEQPTTSTTEEPTTSTTAATTTSSSSASTTTTSSTSTSSTTSTTTTTAPTTSTTVAPPTSTTESPTTTVPSQPPVAPPDVQALFAEFVTEFNQATADDDVDWLYDHLAPAVIDVYGEAACREHVERVIVRVEDLTTLAPALGPFDIVVEVPLPGGGSEVVELSGLYSVDLSYRFNEATATGTGWAEIASHGERTLAYYARCL